MIINTKRGIILETLINYTIEHYKAKKICWLSKRPTEVVCLTKKNSKITGYFKGKSTCDYYGIYNGKYIEFEAKETVNKYLKKQNIKDHQINQLNTISYYGGIGFLIIFFYFYEKYFVLPIQPLNFAIKNKAKINIEFLNKNGYEIKVSYPGIIDFIKIINHLIN